MKKIVLFVAALIGAFALTSFTALAADPLASADASTAIASGGIFTTVLAVLGGLAHVVAILPAPIKSAIPTPILWVLELLAANYGSAKNEDPDAKKYRANRKFK